MQAREGRSRVMSLLLLLLSSIFVNNILLSRFLGCCPFLGVSTKIETAKGMGVAVIFVTVMAAAMTWLVYNLILIPLGVEYLYTLSFILVIAALVQFVELALKKINPALYKSLGIFLPLITTNCAVLGVAVINMNAEYSFIESIVNAFGSSAGFLLAILLMAGIRERIENNENIPQCLHGLPIGLVTAGLMSIAFMGFTGIIK
jgi:electron transport complex protein RnfA